MISPDALLNWYGAAAGRDGYTVPGLDSPQAYHVAKVALDKLGAATGLTRPTPPRQVTAGPVDSPTMLLPAVEPDRFRGWSE